MTNIEYQHKEEQDGQEVAIKAILGVLEVMEVEEMDKRETDHMQAYSLGSITIQETEEVGNKHLYPMLLAYKPERLEVVVNGRGG